MSDVKLVPMKNMGTNAAAHPYSEVHPTTVEAHKTAGWQVMSESQVQAESDQIKAWEKVQAEQEKAAEAAAKEAAKQEAKAGETGGSAKK